MAIRVKSLVREAVGYPAKQPRIDEAAGIIYGAKLIGLESKNRRKYPLAVLKQKYTIYEDMHVFADHDFKQAKTGRTRPMEQWGGVTRKVRMAADGVYGDIHCLLGTRAGRMIMEAAQKFPNKFGMSPLHVVEVEKQPDGSEVVCDILECRSIDAVTRPATTKGLFEQDMTMADELNGGMAAAAATPSMGLEEWFALGTAIIMNMSDADDSEKLAMTKDLFKLKSKFMGGDGGDGDGEEPPPPGEAGESVQGEQGQQQQTQQQQQGQRRPLSGARREMREIKLRMICMESQVPVDSHLLEVLLPMTDDQVMAHLDYIKKQRRRPYGTTVKSGARTQGVAAEELQSQGVRSGTRGSQGAGPPRLTNGAKREDVQRWLSQQ